jgi:hypothetical protein
MHQNAQYVRNQTELFTAFLQTTTPDILAIYEHGLFIHSFLFISINPYKVNEPTGIETVIISTNKCARELWITYK